MNDPTNPMPEASRLPQDAKDLGLLPITAPELQVASSLRADKPMHKVVAWVALLGLLALVLSGIVAAVVGH